MKIGATMSGGVSVIPGGDFAYVPYGINAARAALIPAGT